MAPARYGLAAAWILTAVLVMADGADAEEYVLWVIKRDDLEMIFVCGPGHGGPAVVANTYLECTYSEFYPNVSQDVQGMTRLCRLARGVWAPIPTRTVVCCSRSCGSPTSASTPSTWPRGELQGRDHLRRIQEEAHAIIQKAVTAQVQG